MRAGELNQLITFRQKSVTYNALNEPIETWSDLVTVWAAVETTGGRAFYAAQKKNAETTALFRIRYNRYVSDRMRIKWGNREFEILPPINDANGKHQEVLISVMEVV